MDTVDMDTLIMDIVIMDMAVLGNRSIFPLLGPIRHAKWTWCSYYGIHNMDLTNSKMMKISQVQDRNVDYQPADYDYMED